MLEFRDLDMTSRVVFSSSQLVLFSVFVSVMFFLSGVVDLEPLGAIDFPSVRRWRLDGSRFPEKRNGMNASYVSLWESRC